MKLRTTISYLLFPLTMWYAIGVAVRNFFFASGLRKQSAPHITTIGVGNLATGGTGKTPHVEYLLRLLADKYPTAMLSRGYKRKSKGFVADDGSHNPQQLGDEPAMMAAKFPNVQVAVCEKRIEGVKQLMTRSSNPEAPQLIILDDVFQHRQITPNINILLTEYGNPYFEDRILPFGNLREFRSGRSRAGIVIVTKCPERLNPVEKHNIIHDLRLQNYQKVFFSYLKYGSPTTMDGTPTDTDIRRLDGVLAVTGIANPEPLLAEMKRYTKVQSIAFPDHHGYTKRDIERISGIFGDMPGKNKIIVTTEKDAVRLRGLTGDLPIYIIPIEVAFHKEKDLDFDQIIESSVRENISFLSKLSIWS